MPLHFIGASPRYSTRNGKRRLMKLADYAPIDEALLAALEAEAAEHRKAIRAGSDPLDDRETTTGSANNTVLSVGITFQNAALEYIAENKSGWKNPKHRQQWENTLATYVFPIAGEKWAHEVSMDDVKRILQQPHERNGIKSTLWSGARETASRVRSRIAIIISAAKAKAMADNSNAERQALWRNHHNPADSHSLRYAGLNGKQVKSNFKAMDWKVVSVFMEELLAKSDYSAKALALTILCATRSNETLNAVWSEFDLDNATWTIPAERMKMGKEHRVPLPTTAVTLLQNMLRIEGNDHVFPGAKPQRPLSNMAMLEMLRGMRENEGLTVHGFRSSFRDWITETTLHPDALAEQALAHTIDNKVERAYRRGDAFEWRCDLRARFKSLSSIAVLCGTSHDHADGRDLCPCG
jgi:integrase